MKPADLGVWRGLIALSLSLCGLCVAQQQRIVGQRALRPLGTAGISCQSPGMTARGGLGVDSHLDTKHPALCTFYMFTNPHEFIH